MICVFMAERLEGSNAYVLADEILSDLYIDERPATISEFYEKTIIRFRSFQDDEHDRLANWLGNRAQK